MNIAVNTFLLAGIVGVSLGTMCYVCESIDGTCIDEFSMSSDLEVDCGLNILETEDGGCSKYKTKTKVLGAKVVTVARTCGQLYDNTQCAQTDRLSASVLGVKLETWSCSCEGDKCNSGSQLAFSSALILVTAAKYLL